MTNEQQNQLAYAWHYVCLGCASRTTKRDCARCTDLAMFSGAADQPVITSPHDQRAKRREIR